MKKRIMLPIILCGLLASCGTTNSAPVEAPKENVTELDLSNESTAKEVNDLGKRMIEKNSIDDSNGIGVEVSISDYNISYNNPTNNTNIALTDAGFDIEFRIAGNYTEDNYEDLKAYFQFGIKGQLQYQTPNVNKTYTLDDNELTLYIDDYKLYVDTSKIDLVDTKGLFEFAGDVLGIDTETINSIYTVVNTLINNNRKFVIDLNNAYIQSIIESIPSFDDFKWDAESFELACKLLELYEEGELFSSLKTYKDGSAYYIEVKCDKKDLGDSDHIAIYGSGCVVILTDGYLKSIGTDLTIKLRTDDNLLFTIGGKCSVGFDYFVDTSNCLKDFNKNDYNELSIFSLISVVSGLI